MNANRNENKEAPSGAFKTTESASPRGSLSLETRPPPSALPHAFGRESYTSTKLNLKFLVHRVNEL